MSGEKIVTENRKLNKGTQNINLNIPAIQNGLYTLQIMTPQTKSLHKIIVQH
jgi:hypothetical protein